MDERTIIELMTGMIYVTLLTSAPMMLAGLIVGVAVSIIQTAFSIQEQTLSFIPKIIALSLAGVFFGGWILRLLVDYSRDIFINYASLVIK